MRREKYTYNGDINSAIKEVEEIMKNCLGHNNMKLITEKTTNNGVIFYPAKMVMDGDAWSVDITITVRKVNANTSSIKLEDSKYHSDENWRRYGMDKCYDVCKHVLEQVCRQITN